MWKYLICSNYDFSEHIFNMAVLTSDVVARRLQGYTPGHYCGSFPSCTVFRLLLFICLTAHHLVDVLLAVALSFLTYFCIYARTTRTCSCSVVVAAAQHYDLVFTSFNNVDATCILHILNTCNVFSLLYMCDISNRI